MSDKSEPLKNTGEQGQIGTPISPLLTACVILVSAAIGWFVPSAFIHKGPYLLIWIARVGGFFVLFCTLHWAVDIAANFKPSIKKIWQPQEVRKYRNWIGSTVIVGFCLDLIASYVFEQKDAVDTQSSKHATASLVTTMPSASPAPLIGLSDRRNAAEPATVVASIEQPTGKGQSAADREPMRPISQPDPLIGETSHAENYSVTLYIPTRLRDLEVLVDGQRAEIVETQLSFLKIKVPRKQGATLFTLESHQLQKPKELRLNVTHDNFEYSPFQ